MKFIQLVFFSDSCSYLVNISVIDKAWCGNSFQGFSIKNPFRLSLDLYFRRMIYYSYTNLTDAVPSTGIYSDPFKQLFKYFTERITAETNDKFTSVRTSVLAIAILLNILSCLLIIIFIVNVGYFKRKTSALSKGLICLIDN